MKKHLKETITEAFRQRSKCFFRLIDNFILFVFFLPLTLSITIPLPLSIADGPVCTQGRQTVTAIEGETIELDCQVDANPANVTFAWLFNNTVDSTRFRENEVRICFGVPMSSSTRLVFNGYTFYCC